MRPTIAILAALLAGAACADDKPDKALKSAVKATARAASWTVTLGVEAGMASGSEHTIGDTDVSLRYVWQRVGELVAYSEPQAFRRFGRSGGAIFDGSRWMAINQTFEGRVLVGVAAPLPEALAGLVDLARSARWLPEGEDGARRIRLEGPVKRARERLAALQRGGAFDDEEQLERAGEENFTWETPPSLENIDRSRGRMQIVVELDGDGRIRTIEELLLFAARGSEGQPLEQALGGTEHVAVRSRYTLSALGAVDTPPDVPAEALRLLR